MRIVVTGGLGFIGSAVIRRLLTETDHEVLNIDCETYAATRGSVRDVAASDRYQHAALDLLDGEGLESSFKEFAPDAVVHLAAESHVDRSIDGPGRFVRTNVVGTYELLQAATAEGRRRGVLDTLRFLHVSTDEVFGSLGPTDPPFSETTPYDPRSPYSASKAGADHLVRSWHETFGLPTIVTNCSNNYGPFHFPEKLIPLTILNALAGKPLPVYGRGENVRDWLFVDDHARGIVGALESGQPGDSYLFGGNEERRNLDVVELICDLVDRATGSSTPTVPLTGTRRELIEFVPDRPGHDHRYAVDSSKAERELGWRPSVGFELGLQKTVDWYLENEWWWRPLTDRYDGQRLGTADVPANQ